MDQGMYLGYDDVSAKMQWKKFKDNAIVYPNSMNYSSYNSSGSPAIHMTPFFLNSTSGGNFYWDLTKPINMKVNNSPQLYSSLQYVDANTWTWNPNGLFDHRFSYVPTGTTFINSCNQSSLTGAQRFANAFKIQD